MLNADLIVSPSTPDKTKAYNILKSISNHYYRLFWLKLSYSLISVIVVWVHMHNSIIVFTLLETVCILGDNIELAAKRVASTHRFNNHTWPWEVHWCLHINTVCLLPRWLISGKWTVPSHCFVYCLLLHKMHYTLFYIRTTSLNYRSRFTGSYIKSVYWLIDCT